MKMEEHQVNIIPTEEIRSEPNTYPELILKSYYRALFLAPKFAKENNPYSTWAFETIVRGLHGAAQPYHTETYKAKTSVIANNLNIPLLYSKDKGYFLHLFEWLEEIATLFPKMGVLPPTVVEELDLATTEIIEMEQKEATMKYIKKLLDEKGEKEVKKFIEEIKNPVPEPKIIRPRMTIADVIDKSYLTEYDLKNVEKIREQEKAKEIKESEKIE